MKFIENNPTKYQDLEYDLIYPEVLKHERLFLESKFNVDDKSEYDCIVDYLIDSFIIYIDELPRLNHP
jgi:hypothetical protein